MRMANDAICNVNQPPKRAQYHFRIIERLQNVTTTIYGKVHFWNDEKHWRFIRRNDYRPGDKTISVISAR
jgi:hypothetical protein